MTSRYLHTYVAFVDGLYINDLCDTDSFEEFCDTLIEWWGTPGLCAYIGSECITD